MKQQCSIVMSVCYSCYSIESNRIESNELLKLNQWVIGSILMKPINKRKNMLNGAASVLQSLKAVGQEEIQLAEEQDEEFEENKERLRVRVLPTHTHIDTSSLIRHSHVSI